VSESWVINASPLILFARIGHLHLIERLARTVLIPNAVLEEVRYGQEKDRTARLRCGDPSRSRELDEPHATTGQPPHQLMVSIVAVQESRWRS
jgi:hypothetical protein